MILHGKKVNNGKAEGEAIVSRMPFSFLGDQDPMTGVVQPVTSDIYGQSIAKKVLVIPIGKGSTGGPPYAYIAKEHGNAPVAIVCVKAEPIMAMVAIMNDLPMVHALDQNPLEVIKTGDRVRVDGDAGTVEIL
jgi:predicted aconitase with swiveling domain